MQKLHASIQINAPREKVWDTMMSESTYSEWTEAFNPGSKFIGNWEEGSKMIFVGPAQDGSGKEEGMVSQIKENRKPEFMSIEHLGIYKDGVEDTTSDEAKKWAPAFENYTLTEVDGGTKVSIDMDIEDKYKNEFEVMWNKALNKLKEISER